MSSKYIYHVCATRKPTTACDNDGADAARAEAHLSPAQLVRLQPESTPEMILTALLSRLIASKGQLSTFFGKLTLMAFELGTAGR